MDQPTASTPPPAPAARPNLAYLLIVGVAIGVVSLFTALAWPFAILTGFVIGRSDVDRRAGRSSTGLLRVLAVTGGVLAMLIFGAILGGLIAFLVVALAAFSERITESGSAVDQGIGRILVALVGAGTWALLLYGLGLNLTINIGG
jgi:hypothetical protein